MGDGVNIAARLEGIAEPGGICLSEDAYRQVRDRVTRRSSISASKRSRTSPGPCGFTRSTPAGRRLARREPATRDPRASPSWSSPSPNIGGDPEQEYFVDGVTESLTTDLSRISGSFVIGRNTAFTYKGKACRFEADRSRTRGPLCT